RRRHQAMNLRWAIKCYSRVLHQTVWVTLKYPYDNQVESTYLTVKKELRLSKKPRGRKWQIWPETFTPMAVPCMTFTRSHKMDNTRIVNGFGKTVAAQEYVLVDNQGRQLAVLSATQGKPALAFYNGNDAHATPSPLRKSRTYGFSMNLGRKSGGWVMT